MGVLNVMEQYLNEMANVRGVDVNLPVSLFFSQQPENHKIRPIRFKVSNNPQSYQDSESIPYAIIENDNGEVINIESLTDNTIPTKSHKKLLLFIMVFYDAIKKYWNYESTGIEFKNDILKSKPLL